MEQIDRERILRCPECGSLVFSLEEEDFGDELICPVGCNSKMQLLDVMAKGQRIH